METSTRRKAKTTFRMLQSFEDFCYHSNNKLQSVETEQTEKLLILRNYTSYFVTGSLLSSLRKLKEVLNCLELECSDKRSCNATVMEIVSEMINGTMIFHNMIKEQSYPVIGKLSSQVSMSITLDANENDYFDGKDNDDFLKLVEGVGKMMELYILRLPVINTHLGSVILYDLN